MEIKYSLEDISQIAKQIIEQCNSKIVLFYAEMGMGKTTLIKELVKQLGVNDVTSSPTFSLVNEYLSGTGEKVFHFDFYRINNEEEAYDIGIEDYFYSDAWCFIEWPSSIENLLPLESVKLYITKNDNDTRNIKLVPSS